VDLQAGVWRVRTHHCPSQVLLSFLSTAITPQPTRSKPFVRYDIDYSLRKVVSFPSMMIVMNLTAHNFSVLDLNLFRSSVHQHSLSTQKLCACSLIESRRKVFFCFGWLVMEYFVSSSLKLLLLFLMNHELLVQCEWQEQQVSCDW